MHKQNLSTERCPAYTPHTSAKRRKENKTVSLKLAIESTPCFPEENKIKHLEEPGGHSSRDKARSGSEKGSKLFSMPYSTQQRGQHSENRKRSKQRLQKSLGTVTIDLETQEAQKVFV